ncbi:MAG: relaxase/mobilization nuclease domain-containing protein [Desulforhopalus sp.]
MRKIKRGKGFRGAVSYAINREPGDEPGQIIGGNMSSKTVKKLSSEFGASRKLRPDIEKPVWHNALRLPEGERVEPAKLVEIADDYMQRMGFTDLHQRLYVLHDDPDGQHVHIVASRVGLDGSIYLGRNENLESTRHIQALEKSHNLEITKGPTLKDGKIVMPGKKKETQRETEWALANGKRPDRLELQDLIDDALQTSCTAPEFAERLALAGVTVLPNIASTGTMNGFSFKLSESILKPLAGSKIGDDYKWSKLQARGVDYDKNRDAAQLTQLKEQFARDAEQFAADQPGVTELTPIDSSRDSSGFAELTPGSGDRNGGDLGATTADQSGIAGPAVDDIDRDSEGIGAVEPDRSGAAEFAPGSGRGDSDGAGTIETDQPGFVGFESDQSGHTTGTDGIRQDDSGDEIDVRSPDSTAAQPDQPASETDLRQFRGNRYAENDNQNDVKKYQGRNRGDRDDSKIGRDEAQQNTAQMVEDTGTTRYISSSGRNNRNDGLSRFKRANAAKSRDRLRAEQREMGANSMEQSNSGRTKATETDRIAARQLDPTAYLESQGYTVKPEGRHMSVQVNGDEVYRVTCKHGGHYVTCDKYGNGIGDNIALVKEIEPGTRYADAIYKLHGDPSVEPRQRPAVPPRTPPKVPRGGPFEQSQGRMYLKGRGISQETIAHAEKSGMVQYIDNAVLFLGRDESGRTQNVTRRAIDASDPVQKRDFRGSDKSYPPILPGDPKKVWIVEGGTDALALHDIAKRSNQQPPTVIVSGGANVRSFFDNPEVKAIIEKADKITISGENEKNTEAQARADAGHKKQAEKAGEISRGEIQTWTPPPQDKDLAALNVRQQSHAEQNRLKYEELQQQMQEKREREQDRGPDYSPGMNR